MGNFGFCFLGRIFLGSEKLLVLSTVCDCVARKGQLKLARFLMSIWQKMNMFNLFLHRCRWLSKRRAGKGNMDNELGDIMKQLKINCFWIREIDEYVWSRKLSSICLYMPHVFC